MPNWCAPQVPMCRSWLYKAAKPPLRKADHLSVAIGYGVWLAIEYRYKLGQKMNLNFSAN